MQSLVFLFLVLVIFASAFSFMVYRHEIKKRAREMRRKRYYDILRLRPGSALKRRTAS
jgi:preprotein translocase subunit YajC